MELHDEVETVHVMVTPCCGHDVHFIIVKPSNQEAVEVCIGVPVYCQAI